MSLTKPIRATYRVSLDQHESYQAARDFRTRAQAVNWLDERYARMKPRPFQWSLRRWGRVIDEGKRISI